MRKDKKNWLKDNFSYLVLIFLFGSLVGFIYEELFYLIVDKKIVYQGFLYGPYLPIYGWGCLGLLSLKLSKVEEKLQSYIESIGNMQEDEKRAREQLVDMKELLEQSKSKIREYKLPLIPDSYFTELKEGIEAIREVNKG